MDEETLISSVKKNLEDLKKEKYFFSRFDVWYRICQLINIYVKDDWARTSRYISHEPTIGFVKFCFCKNKAYRPNKCVHFSPHPCEEMTEVYCIPFDTLELRTHEKLKCSDGEYQYIDKKELA